MAGPIQTAISNAITAASVGIGVGAKVREDERQASKARIAAQNEAEEKTRAENEEAQSVALEADLRGMGASKDAATAYRLAMQRGLAQGNRILYDEKGEPIATYSEMAQIMSSQSLNDSLTSRLRTKDSVKFRKQLLEGGSHEQRVKAAQLSMYEGRKK